MTVAEEPPTGEEAEHLSPEAAFSLLGNDRRLAIIQALSAADGPLTFSELREEVGERDSGKFNYHLGQLADHFVRRTETEAGDPAYELTLAGSRVVGAVLEGRYTASAGFDPIEIDDPCPLCGGELVAEYAEERVLVHCTDCEEMTNQFTFPPGTVGQFEPAELPEAFDRWLQATIPRLIGGFCLNCSGRLDAALVPNEGPEDAVAKYDCPRCTSGATVSPLVVLLFHPAGVAFCYDHGLAITRTPTWVAGRLVDHEVELRSTDPPRARVSLRMDDERLVGELTAGGELVDVRREPVDAST